MSDNTTCPYCGKVCKSTGGIGQHISKTTKCNHQQRLQVIATASVPLPPNPEAQHTQIHLQLTTGTRRSMRLRIRNQDATGSERFSTESVDGPSSDQQLNVWVQELVASRLSHVEIDGLNQQQARYRCRQMGLAVRGTVPELKLGLKEHFK